MSTRDSEAQTCSRRMPLSILLTKAAQTSVGGAKTAGSWLDAKSHSAMAQANEISTHTQLGYLRPDRFVLVLHCEGLPFSAGGPVSRLILRHLNV